MKCTQAIDALRHRPASNELDDSTKSDKGKTLSTEGQRHRVCPWFAVRSVLTLLVLSCIASLVMNPQALAQNTSVGADAEATGQNSTAVGHSASATGQKASALGRQAQATGRDTTALGTYSRATADSATAVGENARAIASRATAIGEDSRAIAIGATAVGENSLAISNWSTAIGREANATAGYATAVGVWSRSYGEGTTSLGSHARSYGDHSTAVGRWTSAVGDRNTAVGRSALAAARYDSQTYQLLDCLNDPQRIYNAEVFADDCTALLTDAEKQDSRLRQEDATGETFRATIRARLQVLLDDLSVSRATTLGYTSRALNEWATAVGSNAYATGDRGTALGGSSLATGDRSTALGSGSRAVGDRSTAIGRRTSVSGEDGIGIGSYAHAHGDEAVALGALSGAGAWNVGNISSGGNYADTAEYLADEEPTRYGTRYAVVANKIYAIADLERIWSSKKDTLLATALANSAEAMSPTATYSALTDYLKDSSRTDHTQVSIGDNVYKVAELEEVWSSLDDAILASALADASEAIGAITFYESVQQYLDDDDRTDRTQVYIDGKVYSVADLEAVEGLNEDSLPSPLTGKAGAIAVGVGAQATGEKAIAIGLDTHAVGLNAIAIGARVTASENEVVIGSEEHTYRFPGLATSQTVNPEVLTVDSTGQFLLDGGDLYERVSQLESNSGTTSGSAGGLGTRGTVAALRASKEVKVNQNINGDENSLLGTPSDPADEDGSAFARIAKVREDVAAASEGVQQTMAKTEAVERGELGSNGYEEAPEVGSGGDAPANAANRRVVIQDANADGSVRLRTMEIPELSSVGHRLDAFDDRLNSLDKRLESATAMSSALSALPNAVPDGGKLFLGVGVGHYGGKQAIAMGLSARLGSKRNLFVNAGVATATGGESVSARAGVGFVWR